MSMFLKITLWDKDICVIIKSFYILLPNCIERENLSFSQQTISLNVYCSADISKQELFILQVGT